MLKLREHYEEMYKQMLPTLLKSTDHKLVRIVNGLQEEIDALHARKREAPAKPNYQKCVAPVINPDNEEDYVETDADKAERAAYRSCVRSNNMKKSKYNADYSQW